MLPDKGTLIKVMHDDGSVCDFEEYPSIASFLNSRKKERKKSKNNELSSM